MAAITQTLITDDINGKEGATNVQFALDGKTYEIDLDNLNAANLRRSLAKYIEAGREVKATGKRQARKTTAPNTDAARIRAWAVEAGIPVGTRGRIHPDVVAQFEAAHTAPAAEVEAPAES